MSDTGMPTPTTVEPWFPHHEATPKCSRNGESVVIAANGTRSLSGGWDLAFDNARPGTTFRLTIEAAYEDVPVPRDMIDAMLFWTREPDGDPQEQKLRWDNPRIVSNTMDAASGRVTYDFLLTVPEGATGMVLRLLLRWTTTGRVVFSPPILKPANAPKRRPPLTIAVVTGAFGSRPGGIETIQQNIDYYLPLCEAACDEGDANGTPVGLIVLPEICLQWGLNGHAFDKAIEAPGPETEPFQELARRRKARVCLPVHERDGDAVYNSALLISPAGEIDGRYHKVHLANARELNSGVVPGDTFPVVDTEIGRVGCNICMDSSRAESSRMVGLGGAELLLLPIMGDHRASRWSAGNPVFQEDRWRIIMRVHAMDNHLCLVAARNNGQASCIVERNGEIVAWNEGDRDFILGTVDLDRDYRTWTGGGFREEHWQYRRPSVYGLHCDPLAPRVG